jgi:hypothetical protein
MRWFVSDKVDSQDYALIRWNASDVTLPGQSHLECGDSLTFGPHSRSCCGVDIAALGATGRLHYASGTCAITNLAPCAALRVVNLEDEKQYMLVHPRVLNKPVPYKMAALYSPAGQVLTIHVNAPAETTQQTTHAEPRVKFEPDDPAYLALWLLCEPRLKGDPDARLNGLKWIAKRMGMSHYKVNKMMDDHVDRFGLDLGGPDDQWRLREIARYALSNDVFTERPTKLIPPDEFQAFTQGGPPVAVSALSVD